MINFDSLNLEFKKRIKIDVILTVIFSILSIASILLFILLSNYKIQVVMSVIGSIISSILAIILVYIVYCHLLVDQSIHRFYVKVLDEKEEDIKIENILVDGFFTIKKNISLEKIIINDKEYYSLLDKIPFSQGDTVIIRGQYIVGKKDE